MINTLETKTNNLVNEKSPYLLQHANNPVNWFPWGEEAFEKAKNEDKPIFLSIGYSTCHWCHVMEKESFEDEEVAEILNKHFISIKVDREERPDVDSIYMKACQIMTGRGGWPLSAFLTTDKKPFFMGTNFPKKSMYGTRGLIDILNIIVEAWYEKREDLIKASDNILKAVKGNEEIKKDNLSIDTVHKLYGELESYYDKIYGGFGSAPKFPTAHYLLFLLRYYKVTHEENAINIVEKALDGMYKGGIFDHVGFGFSRYSTDNKWLIPHFEKMLYDNALLSLAYTEGYLSTGNKLYREVSEKVFKYVFDQMQSEQGGFYTAEDADSEGVEGKFYVWTREEIINILGQEIGELYCSWYDISLKGNFEGKCIPNLIKSDITELQKEEETKAKLDNANKILYTSRKNRIPPYKDDKILTSWNGLMIVSLSYASRSFDNGEYLASSERAIDFILNNLVNEKGRLLARYREGDASINGYIDDYVFFIWGLIETYEASLNDKYLEKAKDFFEDMMELFWDDENGGFYLYGSDSEQLISRPKEIYDGAIPSGNSTASIVMLKLYSLTGEEKYKYNAEDLLNSFSGNINSSPLSYVNSISALLMSIQGYKKIGFSGGINDNVLIEMIKLINQKYLPFTNILFTPNDDKPTLNYCDNVSCKEPITSIEEARRLTNKL